jgi:hypothetical protein
VKVKRTGKNKLFIAWMLVAIWLAPQVAKPVHVYHHGGEKTECAHAKGGCENCPVCHFTFSLFVEADAPDNGIFLSYDAVEPVPYPDRASFSPVSFSHLRGPPVA